jgi:hypothetical protein
MRHAVAHHEGKGTDMDVRRAFFDGVLGGLVASLVMGLGRSLGITALNVELLLGSLVTHDLSPLAGALGVALYLLIAGLIACLYAAAFRDVTHRATWGLGVLFSLVHLGMTGLVMDALGALHPLMVRPPVPLLAGQLLAPGLFAANFGAHTVAGFVALHLVYGGIVGARARRVPRRRLVPAVA